MDEELLGNGGGVRIAALTLVIDADLADSVRLRGDLAQEDHVQDSVGERPACGLLQDELRGPLPDGLLAYLEARGRAHGAQGGDLWPAMPG